MNAAVRRKLKQRREPQPITKTAQIAAMLKRRKGVTAAEVMEAVGWPSVSMPQQARLAGIKLGKVKEDGKPLRYFSL